MSQSSSMNSETLLPSILPFLQNAPPKVLIRRKSVVSKSQQKKRKTVLVVKSHPHPWSQREDLSEAYELPASQREGWWRAEIKVTPVPGTYETRDFIDDLNARPCTYNFKAESRLKLKDPPRAGLYLLPGGYEYQDFIHSLSTKPATYRFKAGERFASDVLNFGIKDKDVNVAPNAYSTQNYLAIDGEKMPVKNYMFRSQTKRFHSQPFKLKDGPGPGAYNVKDFSVTTPVITSCFRSKLPRFQEPTAKENL